MSIAYYNGDFCNFEDVRLSLSDRAIFFGDGIYDAAIGKDGGIYLEDDHIERFFSNAERMNIPLKMTRGALSRLLRELIAKNRYGEYFIYIQLSRYSEERIHAYPDTERSNLLITIKKHTLPSPDKTLRLITLPDIRYSMCDVKTLNLLPAVLASKKAEESGCDEAVLIRDGSVTECAHSNIHIVKDGVLYTHPNGKFILPGITRKRLLYFCDEAKIEVRETPFTKNALYEADEILVTSTTRLCQRALEIDGKCIVGGDNSIGNYLISSLYEDFRKKVC